MGVETGAEDEKDHQQAASASQRVDGVKLETTGRGDYEVVVVSDDDDDKGMERYLSIPLYDDDDDIAEKAQRKTRGRDDDDDSDDADEPPAKKMQTGKTQISDGTEISQDELPEKPRSRRSAAEAPNRVLVSQKDSDNKGDFCSLENEAEVSNGLPHARKRGMYTHTPTRTHARVHTRIRTHAHGRAHAHTYSFERTQRHTHARVHAHTHTHAHTDTHTHTHTC
jgi:hypothetical protein